MVNAIALMNTARFAGRVETTAAFQAKGSPTVKGYVSKELATLAATLNDRVVVRVDHVDGADRVDLFLDKGFRELRPVQRFLTGSVTTKAIPGNELPFEFEAPTPVSSGKSFWGEWLAKRRASKATATNNKAFLAQVLAKARFLSDWEEQHPLLGVPGITLV